MPLLFNEKRSDDGVLIMVIGSGQLATTDSDIFHTFFKNKLETSGEFKMFIDLRAVENASMNAIKTMVKHMNSFKDLARTKVIATSVVISDTTIEKLLGVLFSFSPPATPTKVTTSIEDACEFLNSS